jgi:steroid delta-isomerase-like uncharacterized protein
MSSELRKGTMTRWVLEVWSGGNLNLVDELTSNHYVYRAPGIQDVQGQQALKDLVTLYRTAFPDLSNTIEDQVAEGDTVVTRGTTRGTHKAALGDVPASGKRVAVPWVLISKFDGDKIVAEWEVYDSLGLMQQIGAVPTGK